MRWLAVLLLAAFNPAFAQEEAPLRVLFFGNSYTYFNDLPNMVSKLAGASAGRKIEARSVTRGGANLSEVWSVTNAVETLRNGEWDVVVLQDQSTLGSSFIDGRWQVNDPAGLLRWSKFWQAEIQRKNAKTIFYLTWARKARPEFQTALNYAYAEASVAIGAQIAPAGLAWKRLRETQPQIELFDPDGSHPSPVGTLVNACVFLETLVQRSCAQVALPPTTVKINEADWKAVAMAAEFAVEQYKAGALANPLKPDFGTPRTLTPSKETEWTGEWRGNALIYDGVYQMHLHLIDGGKACQGTIQISHPVSKVALQYPLALCKVENGFLTFGTSDVRGSIEDYKAVLQEGKIVGAHALRSLDPYRRVAGSFELKRHAEK
jgi:hypothetical protein